MRIPRLSLVMLLWGLLCGAGSGPAWSALPLPGTSPGQAPVFAQPYSPPAALPAVPALHEDQALQISRAAIGRQLSEHVLLDRQGRPVKLSQFQGKPLLVSFVYTGCFQICPTSTRALREALPPLVQAFGMGHFNVVSIGFNQPADTPQAMRAFAAQHGVDAPNWHFLSPPPASVDALTRDLGFSYVATPAGFDHVLGVTVVDGQGRVHAQVYGDRIRAEQLGEPLRQLLRAAPMPERIDLASLVERVRLVCTVYDPTLGRYRYDYGLILEIAGGLTFALFMLWFFITELRSRWQAHRQVVRGQAMHPPTQPPTHQATEVAR